MKNLKKIWIVVAIVAVVIVWGLVVRNVAVKKEVASNKAFEQVRLSYELRLNLIENLVSFVKGYSNFEQESLTKVIETEILASEEIKHSSFTTPEIFDRFNQVQDELYNKYKRLLVDVQKFPEIIAHPNFVEVKDKLKENEQAILMAKKAYNAEIDAYNKFINFLPNQLIAKLFRFDSGETFTLGNVKVNKENK